MPYTISQAVSYTHLRAEDRLAIARRIVRVAAQYGIPKQDILIDCLTLTASAQQSAVLDTLRAVSLVKEQLGVKTVLGVSNVSFGLPNRPLLNSVFLASAMGAGLDAAILNPMNADMMRAVDTFRVINGNDKDAAFYIEHYASAPAQTMPAAEAVSYTHLDVYKRQALPSQPLRPRIDGIAYRQSQNVG